jgi:beta-glucosidase
VLGCANHYIASGEPYNGLNFSPMDLSERRLRELYLPPFKAAVDAGVETIMLAHNEVNGIPCHSNKYLIEDVLRGELGFKGFIVSDWMDVERLHTLHRVAESKKEACRLAIEAGLDMNMHGPEFFQNVVELVNEGQISEARIDQSVRRILKAKFQLGLFENVIVNGDNVNNIVLSETHKALALKAARQSIVLLKNEGNLLPLTFNPKRILITGPNANNHTVLGDWTKPQPAENVTTVLEGLTDIITDDIILDFYDCGEIWELNENDIERAVQKAKKADMVILVVGENSLREHGSNKTCGENVARDNIDLPGMQSELIDNIQKTGIPTVVVLINGRPNASPWMTMDIPAIIESWEPGMYGGQAIAEVIFGKYNPGGKLPITIPRNVGQILSVYNHRPSSYFRSYVNNETGPLFPFGFGLSYTTFEYSDLHITDAMERNEEAIASCTVTNTGELAGDEVILVFLTDLVSSVTTPVKKLVSFKRISLAPGESKNVEFTVTMDDMSLLDKNMKKMVEPGEFELIMGLDKLKGKFEVKR